ncbi:MAG: hypothetical protein MUF34_13695 [Polyangiaceae bacterium]|nr:hypothetical protein [Polyangiaceae bacterium]
MSLVMAASVVVFSGALAGLLVARRRLARALETERLEALVARELAGFDQRCASKEGGRAGQAPKAEGSSAGPGSGGGKRPQRGEASLGHGWRVAG